VNNHRTLCKYNKIQDFLETGSFCSVLLLPYFRIFSPKPVKKTFRSSALESEVTVGCYHFYVNAALFKIYAPLLFLNDFESLNSLEKIAISDTLIAQLGISFFSL
jgi:hypothetical protein